jgi:hypothetical protein
MLSITDSPVCGSNEPRVVGVALMESIELTCNVVSNPDQLVFHWSFNNSMEGADLTIFKANGSR